MHFLTFNSLRNTFKSGLVAFVFLFVSTFAFGGGSCSPLDPADYAALGGAVCLYIGLDGTVFCNVYENSGVPCEADCSADAVGGLQITCGDYWMPCVSNSFTNAPSYTYCFYNGDASCVIDVCLAATNPTLPIGLIDFNAVKKNEENLITWSTENEANNNYYIIEHSIDAINWAYFAQLPGAGYSSNILSYRVAHRFPEPVLHYYKLTQVDYDGKSASYGPISIDNRDQKRKLLKVCNMLGQEVNDNYRGIVIYHYSDGSYEKIYK
jgi:hypothetical protein